MDASGSFYPIIFIVPVSPAGPILITAGIAIVLLSWCSAAIEATGRQSAETSLLRVRLFTKTGNDVLTQSIEANAAGKTVKDKIASA